MAQRAAGARSTRLRRGAGLASSVFTRGAAMPALLLASALLVAGCAMGSMILPSTSPSSLPPTSTATTVVGTSTVISTRTAAPSTRTVPGTTVTVTTVTGSPSPSAAAPPPATSEPAPVPGTCPYLSNSDVMQFNGQHTGRTSIIATKPYPVCIFTRADGGYLATTRIVVAATPAQAVAAVNQHVPPAESNPAIYPAGWSGGAMATPKGVPGYPQAGSIYAVSKGNIAIIAISNQDQSVKGRQMVEQIVTNLKL